MTPSPRPSRLTDQRLQRLSLWLALTIAWFAAHVLNTLAPKAAARLSSQHAHYARMLLVLHAVRRLAFTAPRRGPIPIDARNYTTRRVAGAALRRALRQGPRALCAILAAPERWVALVVRRLARGLTKLRRLPKVRRAMARESARFMPTPPLVTVTS